MKTLWDSAPIEVRSWLLENADEWWILQLQQHKLGHKNWTGKEGQLPTKFAKSQARSEYVRLRRENTPWAETIVILARQFEVGKSTIRRWTTKLDWRP